MAALEEAFNSLFGILDGELIQILDDVGELDFQLPFRDSEETLAPQPLLIEAFQLPFRDSSWPLSS